MHPRSSNSRRNSGRHGSRRDEHQEILEAFPDLVREDLTEAIRYAAEAVRERELPLVGRHEILIDNLCLPRSRKLFAMQDLTPFM